MAKNAKKGLSKRDRLLIYLCSLIVIGFLGYNFIIKPLIEKKDELDSDSMNYGMTFEEMFMASSDLGAVREELTELTDKYKMISTYYAMPASSEDIDTLFTGLVQKASLKPLTLEIGETELRAIEPYLGRKSLSELESLDLSQEAESTDEAAAEEEEAYIPVATTDVTLTCRGSRDSLFSFLNTVNGLNSMNVTSFSLTVPTDEITDELIYEAVMKAYNVTLEEAMAAYEEDSDIVSIPDIKNEILKLSQKNLAFNSNIEAVGTFTISYYTYDSAIMDEILNEYYAEQNNALDEGSEDNASEDNGENA